ncbi:MAG: hypothetical protein ACRYF8_10475 [Janthinobacterium lividum]
MSLRKLWVDSVIVYGFCLGAAHAGELSTMDAGMIERLRNSDYVGDPTSVRVKNVMEIHNDPGPSSYCGETIFIGRGQAGWSGWVPFVADDGVFLDADDPKFDLTRACLPRKESNKLVSAEAKQAKEKMIADTEKKLGPKAAAELRALVNSESE